MSCLMPKASVTVDDNRRGLVEFAIGTLLSWDDGVAQSTILFLGVVLDDSQSAGYLPEPMHATGGHGSSGISLLPPFERNSAQVRSSASTCTTL